MRGTGIESVADLVVKGLVVGALVAGVLVGVVAGGGGPAGAVESRPEWGSVESGDGVLKKGCRRYRFTYAVTPPEEGYWDLGVTVVGPGGKRLFYTYVPEGSPRSGTATYRLCRSKTRPGRFRLVPVVTVMESSGYVQGRLDTERFRLRARRS